MLISPQLEGASADLKAQIEAFAKNAEAAKWDIYPARHEGDGKVFLNLYRQEFTQVGTEKELLAFMPATLQHLGNGVFALAKPAKDK